MEWERNDCLHLGEESEIDATAILCCIILQDCKIGATAALIKAFSDSFIHLLSFELL